MFSFITEELIRYKIQELRDEAERIGSRWAKMDRSTPEQPEAVKFHGEWLAREEVTR